MTSTSSGITKERGPNLTTNIVQAAYDNDVGGAHTVIFIEIMAEGELRTLVIAYGCVGVYHDQDHYWESNESDPPLQMVELL